MRQSAETRHPTLSATSYKHARRSSPHRAASPLPGVRTRPLWRISPDAGNVLPAFLRIPSASADDPIWCSDFRKKETASRPSRVPRVVRPAAAPQPCGANSYCPVGSCLAPRSIAPTPSEVLFAGLRRLANHLSAAKSVMALRLEGGVILRPCIPDVNARGWLDPKCDHGASCQHDVRRSFGLCSFHLPQTPKGG